MSENTTADTTAKETTQDTAQLTINDLVAMKSIIDIASQRGTFKPNEMTVVGQTYTKLMTFLESVKQQGETK
jgi:ABC-type transporter lipoprotein component MlaA